MVPIVPITLIVTGLYLGAHFFYFNLFHCCDCFTSSSLFAPFFWNLWLQPHFHIFPCTPPRCDTAIHCEHEALSINSLLMPPHTMGPQCPTPLTTCERVTRCDATHYIRTVDGLACRQLTLTIARSEATRGGKTLLSYLTIVNCVKHIRKNRQYNFKMPPRGAANFIFKLVCVAGNCACFELFFYGWV